MGMGGLRIPRFHLRRIVIYVVFCGCCCYLISVMRGTMVSPIDTRTRFAVAVGHFETDRPDRSVLNVHAVSSNERETVEFENPTTTFVNGSKNMVPADTCRYGDTEGGASSGNVTQLPWCPLEPDDTDCQFTLKLNDTTHEALVAELGLRMQDGGHFRPCTCRSREHLAILIPYREREQNLLVLLHNLLPFLWRQMIQFTVFLVEQTADHPFNKGVLFNAAFAELEKEGGFTCYVMQDVDLIPMDPRNLYRCGDQPRHLCLTTGQTEWPNKLMYPMTFGGAVALRPTHIQKANGFSVAYYGWGLEDDDLVLRLKRQNFRIARYPIPVGKYYKLDHERMPYNPQWKELMKTLKYRQTREGLNTLRYTLVRREKTPLYTRFLVQVPPPPPSIYDPHDTATNDTATNDTADQRHG